MYTVYDVDEFKKIDLTQVKILFIGFSIAAYIWLMGFDITDSDTGGAYDFFNHMLPDIINHGISTNIGYFFWRMVDIFSIATILTGLIISTGLTIITVIIISNITPSEIIV